MDDNFKNENRNGVRRHLLIYLNVRNAVGGEHLGRLGDISDSGLLLLLKSEIKVGTKIRISIEIPERFETGRATLELEAEVRWLRGTELKGTFEAGCSILEPTDEDLELIGKLIERIGFSDGTRKIFLKNEENVFREI